MRGKAAVAVGALSLSLSLTLSLPTPRHTFQSLLLANEDLKVFIKDFLYFAERLLGQSDGGLTDPPALAVTRAPIRVRIAPLRPTE